MFPFDDVIMEFTSSYVTVSSHQLHSYKWNPLFVSIILLKQVRYKYTKKYKNENKIILDNLIT